MVIAKELYDCGYRITGEGRRLDVIDSENNKYWEIFFFSDVILIMNPNYFMWVNKEYKLKISCLYNELPQIEIY